ncbi:hypothetical protein [Streptomyces hirsutus]|uniref:hypothetical protein n=1 Tax=Streptomyces hirsutus TaxID=35620 RepID=UPI003324DCFC
MTVPVRPSDLSFRLRPGDELEATTDLILRYEQAPDLPAPIRGVGPMDGPVVAAWCPQCQAAIEVLETDNILVASPFHDTAGLNTLWPETRKVATLISVRPCGHAFRVMEGQAYLEVRESTA